MLDKDIAFIIPEGIRLMSDLMSDLNGLPIQASKTLVIPARWNSESIYLSRRKLILQLIRRSGSIEALEAYILVRNVAAQPRVN